MNVELQRQHEEAKARRARMSPQSSATPLVAAHVDHSLHQQPVFKIGDHIGMPLRVRAPVIRAVSIETGVHIRDIMGRAQFAFCTRARQIAMYVLVVDAGLSYAAAGRYLGRDHTTVMHAVKMVGARLEGDAGLRAVVGAVRRQLGISTAVAG